MNLHFMHRFMVLSGRTVLDWWHGREHRARAHTREGLRAPRARPCLADPCPDIFTTMAGQSAGERADTTPQQVDRNN